MSAGERILIVEDEKLIRMSTRQVLEEAGYRVSEAEDGATGLQHLRNGEIDLVLLDYRLPDMDGLQVLRRMREFTPETAVILITAHAQIGSAFEVGKLGAYDHLDKPFKHDHLLATIARALETTGLRREVKRLRGELKRTFGGTSIVGRSEAMQQVSAMIRRVASTAGDTVLIEGESGTGKDLVARAIHLASNRADGPFMNIRCSELPETLLESELFGHERGASTDAGESKKGLLELADGGTVLLDEITEMGVGLQAKLLRFLEDESFKRVGGSTDIAVDVRVVAASNRSLQRAVQRDEFREDLHSRLEVMSIHLPSLAERREDIPDLVAHFIGLFNGELGKNIVGLTPDALDCLVRHPWPGNVRELRNVIERVMILRKGEQLDLTDLPEEIVDFDGVHVREPGETRAGEPDAASSAAQIALAGEGVSMREMERAMVRRALEQSGGDRTRAARLLRISRDALRYKMQRFGLD
jgi:DNA-binding NtrC family response regulator